MQTLSDIRKLLAEAGTHPKKRFGQNFLHDHNKLHQITESAEVSPNDVVLEVGAGTGALSEALLEAGARLIAVEVDDDLVELLRRQLADRENVTILHADILTGKHALNLSVVEHFPTNRFKLVANLPYNIASPLLVNLGLDHPAMDLAVVMVQKEVADRLTASPGGKTYGPLGVILQSLFEMTEVSTLPPSCFYPAPQVSSAVVKMVRRPQPLATDAHAFAAFVHKVFHRRRKQLGSILGSTFRFPEDIDPKIRPERLSVPQWVKLFEASREAESAHSDAET